MRFGLSPVIAHKKIFEIYEICLAVRGYLKNIFAIYGIGLNFKGRFEILYEFSRFLGIILDYFIDFFRHFWDFSGIFESFEFFTDFESFKIFFIFLSFSVILDICVQKN